MPIGFISFDFCWEETKPKKINYIGLTVHLIWVRPEKRGLGGVVARHIISHFLSYLEDCNLSPPNTPKGGIDVTYYAELGSLGGKNTSIIIMDYLGCMKILGTWEIRDIDFDVGF